MDRSDDVRRWAVTALIVLVVIEPAVLFAGYGAWLAGHAVQDVPRVLAVSALLGVAGVAGIRAARQRPPLSPNLAWGALPAAVAFATQVVR